MNGEFFTGEHHQRLRELGQFANTKVHLPLDEYLGAVVNEATILNVGLTESMGRTLRRLHQEHHAAVERARVERIAAAIAYVRGPVRDRHKLVVPMVVKAKPKFKKARRV